MNIEWLVTNVTAAGSPDRAEHAILGMNLGILWQIQATFLVESHFMMYERPLEP